MAASAAPATRLGSGTTWRLPLLILVVFALFAQEAVGSVFHRGDLDAEVAERPDRGLAAERSSPTNVVHVDAVSSGLADSHKHEKTSAMKVINRIRSRRRSASEGRPAKPGQHAVQHSKLLNNDGFWWMMGSLILFVALAVVAVEVNGSDAIKEEKRKNKDVSARQLESGASERPRRSAPESTDAAGTVTSMKVLQLLLCFMGLNVCMLLWGIAQEFVMTNQYVDRFTQEARVFPSALFLVLCNRIGSVMFSVVIATVSGTSPMPQVPKLVDQRQAFRYAAMPALTNFLASWSQYAAMAYISFPLQTTAKGGKLLPVLVLGAFRGKRQTMLDYAEALVITSAVVVFGMEDSKQSTFDMTSVGVSLICGMMFLDSITPHLQDILFQKFPDLLVIQANFAMSLTASVFCSLILIFNGHLLQCVSFLHRHPSAMLHVAVLAVCSMLTQFLISYTIKHFGPFIFTIIVTTRQMVSVCISAVLFAHSITGVAMVAAMIVFSTVITRALYRLWMRERDAEGPVDEGAEGAGESIEAIAMMIPEPLRRFMLPDRLQGGRQLMLCALAIHLPLCFWGVAQEFLATHTFGGHAFRWSTFLIAMNRTVGVLFALTVLYLRGLKLAAPSLKLTTLPALTNFVATSFQYEALYYIRFPQQTLLKTLKVVPVMMIGSIMRTRTYHWLEYVEAILLSIVVGFFVSSLSAINMDLQQDGTMIGVILMGGYLIVDSLTSNLEDAVYQHSKLDPGHMLLGTEVACCVFAWVAMLLTGDFSSAVSFLYEHKEASLHVFVLSLAATCGGYGCMVTVRLFGPAVFTLLMMSRQVVSLLISLILFGHQVDSVSGLCMIVVVMLIFMSTLRRVQMQPAESVTSVAKSA